MGNIIPWNVPSKQNNILLVEQNLYQALRVSHRGYVLQLGKIVMEGPSADLLKADEVFETYLVKR